MMTPVMVQTERLFLRKLCQEDFDDLAEILQDPEVMYAYEHDFSRQDVQEWLDRQKKRYETHGFGLWAMILRETGKMIGQAGLTMQSCEGQPVLEIGYHLKRKFWHHGYAREAAEGCKRYAFDVLGADKVYCIIKSDNFPSMRVAESIGMKREKRFIARYYNGDMEHFLYGVSRAEKK